ncbi:DUF523 domain-containing protein [Candidatus Aminicenantes bacterium AH-873-B07]|nr:DUF523 domain-containing protein [Candidatus Aminicenantes bacterium AH-873-B07]
MKNLVLVSSCLVGIPCAYDGRHRLNYDLMKELLKYDAFIPICPELLAGFPTPRPRIEIVNGNGKDIINGRAKVVDENGKNQTSRVLEGAGKAMEIALKNEVKIAFLKERSPLCGVKEIYDGSFKGIVIKGCGVFTALLMEKGIKCIPIPSKRK